MLTPKQKEHTRAGATALHAASRFLNEAVEELAESPVVSNRDYAALCRMAEQLNRRVDVVQARAVRKQVFL